MSTYTAPAPHRSIAGYPATTRAADYLKDLINTRAWQDVYPTRVQTLVSQMKTGTLDAAVCRRAIDALKVLPRTTPRPRRIPDLPDGHYALGTIGAPRRYRVRHYNGRVYVWFVGPNEVTDRLRLADMLTVLTNIDADVPAARELYARVTSRCARCNRLLTVPASVHRGLGPDCATMV